MDRLKNPASLLGFLGAVIALALGMEVFPPGARLYAGFAGGVITLALTWFFDKPRGGPPAVTVTAAWPFFTLLLLASPAHADNPSHGLVAQMADTPPARDRGTVDPQERRVFNPEDAGTTAPAQTLLAQATAPPAVINLPVLVVTDEHQAIPASDLAPKLAIVRNQLDLLAVQLGVPVPKTLPPAFLDTPTGKAVTWTLFGLGMAITVAQTTAAVYQAVK